MSLALVCRAMRQAVHSERCVFVIGNQAGDLDSLCSSVGLAYLLSSCDEAVHTVAVMPIPRDEFRLRRDSCALFERAGFEFDCQGAPTDLVFLDEVPNEATPNEVVLVDHNALCPSLEHWAQAIKQIVDHHTDEGRYPSAKRHIDSNVGSCASIVTSLFIQARVSVPKELAILLLGPILLDTVHFNPTLKRFNDVDTDAKQRLLALHPDLLGEFSSTKELFDHLMTARKDVVHFPAADLLRLDYKQVSSKTSAEIGISAILIPWSKLMQHHTVADTIAAGNEFCDGRKLSALVLLTAPETIEQGTEIRHLAVIESRQDSEHGGIASRLVSFLNAIPEGLPEELATSSLFVAQGVSSEGFCMEQMEVPGGISLFRVSRRITRKTLKPCIELFLAQTSESSSPP